MEKQIQSNVCRFISVYYPDVIYISDQSGLRLSHHGQRQQLKRSKSSRGIPDMIIMCPNGGFHGLCLELKNDGVAIIKRDGSPVANEHIREQHAMITKLNDLGFAAFFTIGLDAATTCIEKYMSCKIPRDHVKRSGCVWMDSIIPGCDIVKID